MTKDQALKNIEVLANMKGNMTLQQLLQNLQCEEKNGIKQISKKRNSNTSEYDLKEYLKGSLDELSKYPTLTPQEYAKIHRAINLVQRSLEGEARFIPENLPESFRQYLTLMEPLSHGSGRGDLKEDKSLSFEEKAPEPDASGQYVLSEGENKVNHMKEAGWIGIETQLKRLLRLAFGRFTKKFDYFHEGENKDPDKIYKKEAIEPIVGNGEVKITNISHACQLIQTNGFNILTDPVFYGLAPIVYPGQTKPAVEPEDLPAIDVIVISHNHRDHLDEPTLKKILASGQNPMIVVPPGKDREQVMKLGFTNVVELNWFQQQEFKKGNKSVLITAAAADHWTNRSASDQNQSSVNSYVITPKEGNGVVYFAGDTAVMSKKRMKSIAAVLFLEIMGLKASGEALGDIKIFNLEPGGPNYARALMKTTHQSGVDSIISAFKIARDIAELAKDFQGDNKDEVQGIKPEEWLEKTLTVFMHHNKFELGPDRFNENVKIYNRLIDVLESCESVAELEVKLKSIQAKDKQKGFLKRNLFNRSEDFIYAGAIELVKISAEIYGKRPEQYAEFKKELLASLEKKVVFPKIGESVSKDTLDKPDEFKSNKRSADLDASQIDKQRQLGGKLQLKESVLDNEEGYYHFKYLVLEYANLASQKNNEMMKGIYSQSKSNVNNPKQHDIGEFEVKGGKVKVDKEKLDKISDAEVLAIIKKYQSTKAAKNNPLSKISDRAKKQAYVKALEGFTFRAKYKEDMVEPLRDQLKWKEYKKK